MANERFLELQEQHHEEQKDRRISDIRDRLPKGVSAVTCEMCEAPIPQRRREWLPGVKTCVDCQELLEAQGAA